MHQILSAQTWNSTQYAENGRFVASLAAAVVDLLDPQPGERILDAGCGDGALRPALFDSRQDLKDTSALWSADYVRLRFHAVR